MQAHWEPEEIRLLKALHVRHGPDKRVHQYRIDSHKGMWVVSLGRSRLVSDQNAAERVVHSLTFVRRTEPDLSYDPYFAPDRGVAT